MTQLKETEAKLDAREEEMTRLYQQIQARIKSSSTKACRYVTAGMKPSEVKTLVGEPDARKFISDSTYDVWSYGQTNIHFGTDTPVVAYLDGCRR